jgi:hypothetical protein
MDRYQPHARRLLILSEENLIQPLTPRHAGELISFAKIFDELILSLPQA